MRTVRVDGSHSGDVVLLKIGQGDYATHVAATLLESCNRAIDLTDATVEFLWSNRATTFTRAATIVSATQGKVSVTFEAPDLDTHGTFDAQFKITFTGGAVLHVPNHEPDQLVIVRTLNT